MTTDWQNAITMRSMVLRTLLPAFFVVCLTVHAYSEASYRMMTGLRAGAFYPVGVALQTLLELKQSGEDDILLDVLPSTGARNNIESLLSGKADIVFADAGTIADALMQRGPFKDLQGGKRLRVLMPLWPDVGHFVIRSRDMATSTMSDFRELFGATVSLGAHSAGSYRAAAETFIRNGIYYDRLFNVPDLDDAQTVSAFLADRVNAFVMFRNEGNLPVELALKHPSIQAQLVSISDVQLEKMLTQELPVWQRHVIDAETYLNQPNRIETVSQMNYLVVRDDFDVLDAFKIARMFFENISFLEALHPSVRKIEPARFRETVIFPMHPGSERYFVETRQCSLPFCLFN
ncbi:MAG: TAXI family TRAP transporter solute-binding subunit [Pseudomonadota bacterium]